MRGLMLTLIALKGEGKAIGKQRRHYFFHTLGSAGDEEGRMGGGGREAILEVNPKEPELHR